MLCSLQEAYFRYMAENPTAGLPLEDEDENVDYDSDGNPIPPAAKKIILPLPPIDHSEVEKISCDRTGSIWSWSAVSAVGHLSSCAFFFPRSTIRRLRRISTTSMRSSAA